jgi:hypothetical protein
MDMAENKIVLVSVWFGKEPACFSVWLKTAAFNSEVDFIVICDFQPAFPPPSNVRIVRETRAEYSTRVSNAFGVSFSLGNAYKLCDQKLFIYSLYSDLLSGYEWFGYCDLDIVWGDLSLDLTPSALKNLDKIGLNAHCSLWRVSRFEGFLRNPKGLADTQKLLDSTRNYALDEHSGLSGLFADCPKVQLFRHDLNLHPCQGKLVPLDWYHRGRDTIYWEQGRLLWREYTSLGYYETEHSYLHMQKNGFTLEVPTVQAAELFVISPGRIFASDRDALRNPQNAYSRRYYYKQLEKRLRFSVLNRLRGGTRGTVVLR